MHAYLIPKIRPMYDDFMSKPFIHLLQFFTWLNKEKVCTLFYIHTASNERLLKTDQENCWIYFF